VVFVDPRIDRFHYCERSACSRRSRKSRFGRGYHGEAHEPSAAYSDRVAFARKNLGIGGYLAMTAMMKQLPMTERDQAFALPTSGASSIAETLSALRAGMQQAVGQMGADDLTLEVDATPGRLHLKFRAYKHRRS
jgi:hypothetical protein